MYMFDIVIDCETMMMGLLMYMSIACFWHNSMGLMRRFYGGVILVYALDYGFK